MKFFATTTALVVVSLLCLSGALCKGSKTENSDVLVLDKETSEASDNVKMEINQVEKIDDYDPDMEKFIPTKEWQVVLPDQSIPRGLHVRMNLETGVKMAKLLDEEAEKTEKITEDDPQNRFSHLKTAMEEAASNLQNEDLQYWKNGDREGMIHKDKKPLTAQEIKEALKKFKASRDDVQDEKIKAEAKEKVYRTADDLKQDMKDLKMNMKSDTEIMTELLQQYKEDTTDNERKVDILNELEYHVHQIDNALVFVNLGGIDLIMKELNNTDETLRSEAAFVLGSATQSNPKVQVSAMEGGGLEKLIRMFGMETSPTVRRRVLYGISSIVRHFPYAQHRFLKLGGLDAIVGAFANNDDLKIQVKAVTLINDLLLEKKMFLEKSHPDEKFYQKKRKQYQEVLLQEALLEHGWCEFITKLLNQESHDIREKVLNALLTVVDSCQTSIQPHRTLLFNVRNKYQKMSGIEKAEEGVEDGYYSTLYKMADSIIAKSFLKEEL